MRQLATLSVVISLVLHAALVASLSGARARAPRRPQLIELEVAATADEASPPPLPAPEPPTPREEAAEAPRPREPAPPPAGAAEADSTPAASAAKFSPERRDALDFSDITLQSPTATGWTSPGAGGGKPRRARSAARQKASRAATPAQRRVDSALVFVASHDLSERPAPPPLQQRLRRAYPSEARRRGISGNASLRVRIDADGKVRVTTLLEESFAGFGDACRKALLGSAWTPPKDRGGRAVATEVRYTCRFVVE